MDDNLAVTLVATSAPGVNREAEAALDVSGATLASRMPFGFPVHQPGSDGKFVAIDLGVVTSEVDVFEKEVHRVHVEFGGEVFQSAVGDRRHMGMIRSTPSARGADVIQNGRVFISDIGRLQDVR